MDAPDPGPTIKRVLIKISGESLMGPNQFGIHSPTVENICAEVKAVKDLGTELALVIGGGNIFRGLDAAGRGMDRVIADNMGTTATRAPLRYHRASEGRAHPISRLSRPFVPFAIQTLPSCGQRNL